MHMPKRHLLCLLAGAAMLAALPARAQDKFPDRPIMFVVPFPPGGPTDAMARILATELTRELGQSVVVDNQPGAGGVVGTQNLVKAAPDGQTLGMVSNNHVIYPSVLKSLPFDPVADVTPIAVVGSTPMVLAAAVFFAGLLMNTAQSSMQALAAAYYPTAGRATGVAWTLGIGRFGGIAGSFFVAELARRHLPLPEVFILVGIPGLVAAAALLIKNRFSPEPDAPVSLKPTGAH